MGPGKPRHVTCLNPYQESREMVRNSKKKEVKVKKLIAYLVMLAILPAAFMLGCSSSSPTSSGNQTPTATIIPGAYLTPQTTPQAPVTLLTAANYVILSYTGITNSGPSTTCGGYGVYPDGLTSITGSPAIVEVCGGPMNVGNPAADQAKKDLGIAYTHVGDLPGGAAIPAGFNVAGLTLYAGLYNDGGDLHIDSGNLTLDAQGNPNAVFISGFREFWRRNQQSGHPGQRRAGFQCHLVGDQKLYCKRVG